MRINTKIRCKRIGTGNFWKPLNYSLSSIFKKELINSKRSILICSILNAVMLCVPKNCAAVVVPKFYVRICFTRHFKSSLFDLYGRKTHRIHEIVSVHSFLVIFSLSLSPHSLRCIEFLTNLKQKLTSVPTKQALINVRRQNKMKRKEQRRKLSFRSNDKFFFLGSSFFSSVFTT